MKGSDIISNKNSNYPSNAINKMPPIERKEITTSILELSNKGKPTSVEELEERSREYVEYCHNNGMPLGIETYALCLNVSRQSVYKWSLGVNCSAEWQEVILKYRQIINAFIEQATLTNKINAIYGIFLHKSLMGYVDTPTNTNITPVEKTATLDEIRAELMKSNQE